MIIWKGAGLMVPVFSFISLWLTKFLFDESLKSSKLHYGVALCIAGLILLLTKKLTEMNMKKIMNSGDEEKIAKYKEAFEKNPMMDYENSSFFFIPYLYWQYILYAGGITLLILYFLR
jgi:hypothetical protein